MSPDDAMLAPQLADRVAAELNRDEELVWAGQPRPDLAIRPAYFMVPIGVFVTLFAVFWMVMAAVITFGLMAPCGVPFLLVGIFLICSPAWLKSRARRTIYALTNERAIIWEPGYFGSSRVRSYRAAGLGRISRNERPDGSGDIVFEEITTYRHDSDGGGGYHTTQRGFLGIDNVRDVEELVIRTLLKRD